MQRGLEEKKRRGGGRGTEAAALRAGEANCPWSPQPPAEEAISVEQPQRAMNVGGAAAAVMRGGESGDSLTEA